MHKKNPRAENRTPEKTPQKRDRMCVCLTAHAPSNKHHLVRAAPRHPANVSHSQIEICQRSPFPDSSNRKSRGPAPPAWVPILCLTTHGKKHWRWWLVSRSEANHLQSGLLFRKSVRKPAVVLLDRWFQGVVFLCSETLKKRAFWVGDFARDPCIYTIGNNCGLCYFGLAQ